MEYIDLPNRWNFSKHFKNIEWKNNYLPKPYFNVAKKKYFKKNDITGYFKWLLKEMNDYDRYGVKLGNTFIFDNTLKILKRLIKNVSKDKYKLTDAVKGMPKVIDIIAKKSYDVASYLFILTEMQFNSEYAEMYIAKRENAFEQNEEWDRDFGIDRYKYDGDELILYQIKCFSIRYKKEYHDEEKIEKFIEKYKLDRRKVSYIKSYWDGNWQLLWKGEWLYEN